MRRSGSDTLISLDIELERTLRRIRKEKKEVVESEHIVMENLREVGNEEDIEFRSEGSSHPSTPRMAHSSRALRDYYMGQIGSKVISQNFLIDYDDKDEDRNQQFRPI